MRMAPGSPYDTGSQAEKRIFERLRRAFDDSYADYHSLRPARRPHKRFPEIDKGRCAPRAGRNPELFGTERRRGAIIDIGPIANSEMTFEETPTPGSILHARHVPARGRDPLFANT